MHKIHIFDIHKFCLVYKINRCNGCIKQNEECIIISPATTNTTTDAAAAQFESISHCFNIMQKNLLTIS